MIRELTADELIRVYREYLTRDFPPAEQRPLEWILDLVREEKYLAVGCFSDSGTLIGYAFLGRSSTGKTLMMDYFAVVKEYRKKGVGSRFFRELREALLSYYGIVYEVESPEAASSDEDYALRQRRISFYLRNGSSMTRVYSRVFGVSYRIMYIPIREDWDDCFVAAELEDAYRVMIPARHYERIIEEIGIETDAK